MLRIFRNWRVGEGVFSKISEPAFRGEECIFPQTYPAGGGSFFVFFGMVVCGGGISKVNWSEGRNFEKL